MNQKVRDIIMAALIEQGVSGDYDHILQVIDAAMIAHDYVIADGELLVGILENCGNGSLGTEEQQERLGISDWDDRHD